MAATSTKRPADAAKGKVQGSSNRSIEGAAKGKGHGSSNRFEGSAKAALVMVIGNIITVAMALYLADAYETTPNIPHFFERFQQDNFLWASFFLVYYLILFFARFADSGTHIIYDMLWGCNIALMLTVVGLFTGRPILVGAACSIVAIDQMCWYLDVGVWLATGKFPIGVAKFIAWPNTSMVKKATTTHHLWFMPLCLYTLGGYGGVRPNSWLLSCFFTTWISIYCRLFTPMEVHDHKTNGTLYLNVNNCHEFWKDIKLKFLHAFNKSHPIIYLAYLSFIGNIVLNLPPYALLRWFSNAFLAEVDNVPSVTI